MQREASEYYKAKQWHRGTRIYTKPKHYNVFFFQVQFWYLNGSINNCITSGVKIKKDV